MNSTVLSFGARWSAWMTPLGWTLVHFLWQGSIIALAVAAALLLLKNYSSNARYGVACAGLVLMSLCPATTLYLLSPRPATVAAENSSPAHTAAFDPLPAASDPRTDLSATSLISNSAQGSNESQTASSVPQAFAAAWLLGVALLSLRLVGGCLLAEKLRRSGTEADAHIQHLADNLRARLRIRSRIPILVTDRVTVPAVVGFVRTVILLPMASTAGLTTEQLAALLAHEFAHVRRHDYLVNLVQTLIETILFYHPAVWWISGRIRAERENCCDDIALEALGDAVAYARALSTLEELRMKPSPVLAANGGHLLGRIRRILGLPPAAAERTAERASAWAAATLAIAFALAGYAATSLQALPFHMDGDAGDLKPAKAASRSTTPKAAKAGKTLKAAAARPARVQDSPVTVTVQPARRAKGEPARADVAATATTVQAVDPAQAAKVADIATTPAVAVPTLAQSADVAVAATPAPSTNTIRAIRAARAADTALTVDVARITAARAQSTGSADIVRAQDEARLRDEIAVIRRAEAQRRGADVRSDDTATVRRALEAERASAQDRRRGLTRSADRQDDLRAEVERLRAEMAAMRARLEELQSELQRTRGQRPLTRELPLREEPLAALRAERALQGQVLSTARLRQLTQDQRIATEQRRQLAGEELRATLRERGALRRDTATREDLLKSRAELRASEDYARARALLGTRARRGTAPSNELLDTEKKLQSLEAELLRLQQFSGEDHPAIREKQDQIRALRAQIDDLKSRRNRR